MPSASRLVTSWSLFAAALAIAASALASVFLLSSPGSASGRPRAAVAHARPASATTISARRTSKGTILVDSHGEVLYAFSRDSAGRERCASIRGCTHVWPLVTTSGRPRAGRGVAASRLSTITVAGRRQVTYAGHPLYTYSADDSPGDTDYIGVSQFGGTWPAVTPRGGLVH